MPNAEMKTLTIGDTTYEIVDEEARESVGDLSDLTTQENTDLVAAINEVADNSGVVSVNGKTGTVVLAAADVGAATTGALTDETTARTAADAQLQGQITALGNGAPIPVSTIAAMTVQTQVYLYTGSETGESTGYWYTYDSSQTKFVPRGEYGGAVTDTTLSISGKPADAKAVGDALATKADSSDVTALGTRVTEVEDGVGALDETVNGITVPNYTEGKNITSAGVITDDDNSSLSELIPLTWTWDSETKNRFYFNKAEGQPNSYYIIVFYDENQNYLGYKGSFGDTERPVVGFDGSAYVRFSFRKGTVGKLTNNGITTTYWIASETLTQKGLVQNVGNLTDLDTTNKDSLVDAINEVKGDIPDFPISPRDTDFFHISKNLINPSECVTGEYVNQATGAFASLSKHNRTDYIEINPSTTYVVRARAGALGANFRYVFYTSAKAYISGAVGALPDMLLTSPANAEYIVISDNSAPSDMMIAPYVDEDKSYEAYDVYLLPEYIKQDMSNVLLNVPSKVYALVGFETNIYFENITEDWTRYDWDVTCAVGRQMKRGYQITPTASDVGTKTLTIKATDEYGNVNTVSTSLVITSASAGSGQTKSVIVLGDSTTNNGKVIEKLNENFDTDVMSVTTLGTRGTAPNNHEGRSGWSWDTYFTKESVTYTDGRGTVYNPFYNPNTQTFDASYYFANSGISKPDFFIVNMGINDVFGFTSDSAYESGVTTILERAENAVQSVLDATTTTKVCACLTIPPNHSQDAFGKAYNCSQTRNRYKRNNTLWVDALMNLFKDRESERIYLIPINACLDTVYNMGMETLPVNARNTDITYQSPISNGGVHPVESGYWQIADVYTAFIKANL